MATKFFTKYAKDVVPGETLTIDLPHEDRDTARTAYDNGAEVQSVHPDASETGAVDIEVSVFLPDRTVTTTVTLDNDTKVDGFTSA